MNKDELNQMLSIVDDAMRKIFLAEKTKDKRKQEKAIREAKKEAQNMVYPHKTLLTDICHMEYLGDELFDWGHLESDLQEVAKILKELSSEVKL